MASLFIDSTYDMTIGILADDMSWLQFAKFANQKASAIIQKETFNLLTLAGLKISEIDSVITAAGPGFYTGLRLSEGFADVFIFSEKKHFSFLSYDIPKMSKVPKGVWLTKAYRGEYFAHCWNEVSSRNELIPVKDLEDFLDTLDKSNFYVHSDSAIDDLVRRCVPNVLTTVDLLKAQPKNIFTKILTSQSKVDSYYFRAPEDEFKVSV